MALDKSTLITSLQTAFIDGVGTDDNALQIATDIADAIDTYVKTARIEASIGVEPLLDSVFGPCTGLCDISWFSIFY